MNLTRNSISDPGLPRVKQSDEVTIAILNPDRGYSYRMQLYRINDVFSTQHCIVTNQVGEIDLSALHSMSSPLKPCEVASRTKVLTFDPYILPHGYLRLAVEFYKKDSLIATIWVSKAYD
ncbi:hypothetical protein ElyMa_001784100 [Elysia marginata]|uniref:Uncharacterized protein n=1 Tax=Elysia marginata TaxID=1093978 RepID=A0AAV4EDI4_9GAST|nr:hypothetical protein ElyMa_001784100 [Elysia marginata]